MFECSSQAITSDIIGGTSTPLGQFHVKGPRKNVNVKKWIFFDKIWKIIMQYNDFLAILIFFCNFWVFLAKNENHPQMTVLKKWKLRKKIIVFPKI